MTTFGGHRYADEYQESFDELPTKRLTRTMTILKAGIDEHLADPELFEAFQGVYTVHPSWEMPRWIVEKMKVRAGQAKEDAPVADKEQDAGDTKP